MIGRRRPGTDSAGMMGRSFDYNKITKRYLYIEK